MERGSPLHPHGGAGCLLVTLLVTLAAACTGSGPPAGRPAPGPPTSAPAAGGSAATTPAAEPAYYRQRLSWRSCGGGFQCSTLRVPLDYRRPGFRLLDLALVRLSAQGPGSRLGSLVVNPGGPGGSGVDYARAARFLFRPEVRARFDIVGFDPRGVGRSSPVRCLSDRELDDLVALPAVPRTPGQTAALVAANQHFAAACLAKNGDLLAHVGTIDTARDLDVLRAALHDQKLTYLGKSYGTFLGAKYAELFPHRVRALVLDGALDPAVGGDELNLIQAGGFERELRDFLGRCVVDGGCPLGATPPAAAATVDRLLARADRSPLPASADRRLTSGEALYGLAAGLYDPASGWPELERALAAGDRGDGAPLLALADALLDRGPDGHYGNSLEANVAVNCIDRPWSTALPVITAKAAAAARAAPHFGAGIVYGSLPCAYWPVPPVEVPHPVRAAGAPPILVVGTTGDPATPYVWAQSLASQLASGRLLTFDGDGHTAYAHGHTCIDDSVDAYLLELRLPVSPKICH